MSDKPKFPRADALDVAREILAVLTPNCERVIVAGSLRRRKPLVGDVEILFIPKIITTRDPSDFLGGTMKINAAEAEIERLLLSGALVKRPNVKDRFSWGEKNKLAIHKASGIPVDLFTATQENWWNYLVCRTGGAESNTQIASAAERLGWHWAPYDPGFRRGGTSWETARDRRVIGSEREVFHFVGLPYLEPERRS